MGQLSFFDALDGRPPASPLVEPAPPAQGLHLGVEDGLGAPDLLDYSDGWPAGHYAALGPPPRVAVMRAVLAAEEVLGAAAAWAILLELWSIVLERLADGWEAREARHREIAARLGAPAMAAASEAFKVLLGHFHHHGAYCDVLGPVHMEVASRRGRSMTGQFFTPWSACLLMAELAGVPETPLRSDGTPWRIHDPAVGAGATLLAARGLFAKRHGRLAASQLGLYGQDIDATCCAMARIQLAMTCWPRMHALLLTAHLPPALARRAVADAAERRVPIEMAVAVVELAAALGGL